MPAQPKKAFALRLDPALYAAIERLAATELRSANAEIEILQLEALTRRAGTFDPVVYPGMKLPVDLTWPAGT